MAEQRLPPIVFDHEQVDEPGSRCGVSEGALASLPNLGVDEHHEGPRGTAQEDDAAVTSVQCPQCEVYGRYGAKRQSGDQVKSHLGKVRPNAPE